MKIIDFFRSRIILFLIQILLLSSFIYSLGYFFKINFDAGTLIEQEVIIQFLANYILFDDLLGLCFIYISWIIVSLLPIFIFNNFKKAYSMNLMTFFFPNFFLYVFLWKYSPDYFNLNFQFHLLHTILLGLVIIGISIGLSLLIKKITKKEVITQIEDLSILASEGKKVCPNCGTEFESVPKFCYKCNTDLSIITGNNNGNKQ
ncbi:MAG: hypothetical protein ACFE9Q_02170 [Candidatus Hodarchaeota archaeon]